MRGGRVSVAVATLGIVGVVIAAQGTPRPWVVLIGGHTAGYLAPCGCSTPMVGGIRRRMTAVRQQMLPDRTLVLEAPGMVTGTTRQDAMKAETLAETLRDAPVDAIAVGADDVALPNWPSVMALAPGKFLYGPTSPSTEDPWRNRISKGPFTVTSTSSRSSAITAVLGTQAKDLPTANVVLFDGDQSAAREFSRETPSARLIVYQSHGEAAPSPLKVGSTWLVSPGDHSRNVLRLTYDRGQWTSYQVVSLDPSFTDDPATDRLYRIYLGRVDRAGLLDKLPRQDGAAFTGSEKCITCHADAGAVWRASAHAHALTTLVRQGHQRDPDCVSCHVTGLSFRTGYRSPALTPELQHVGCESCHGPGADHAAQPTTVKFVNIGENACLPCHTFENSPRFDFLTYWTKIRHGLGITGGKKPSLRN